MDARAAVARPRPCVSACVLVCVCVCASMPVQCMCVHVSMQCMRVQGSGLNPNEYAYVNPDMHAVNACICAEQALVQCIHMCSVPTCSKRICAVYPRAVDAYVQCTHVQ